MFLGKHFLTGQAVHYIIPLFRHPSIFRLLYSSICALIALMSENIRETFGKAKKKIGTPFIFLQTFDEIQVFVGCFVNNKKPTFPVSFKVVPPLFYAFPLLRRIFQSCSKIEEYSFFDFALFNSFIRFHQMPNDNCPSLQKKWSNSAATISWKLFSKLLVLDCRISAVCT